LNCWPGRARFDHCGLGGTLFPARANSFRFVKLLFIAIIALVIPAFFVLVFVMSTVNRLANLRNRCRDARERLNADTAQTAPTATSPPDPDLQGRQDYNLTVEQYNRARKRFPASLLARLWGFREAEPLSRQQGGGSQPAPR
jgi:hypothetical protein